MMKNNKWKLIVSSVVVLLPALFGLIFLDKLPETMTTHWGADGVADGHSSRLSAVLVMPLILLALHWLCLLLMNLDRNKEKAPKLFGMIMWIMPVVSLLANGTMYAVALGVDFNIDMLLIPFMGLLFVCMGNYLPKCRQNNTMGIKIKWTLENEENWNATHRFGGKVWVIGGLLMMAGAFLPAKLAVAVMITSIIALMLIPFVYSGLYHRKQVREGVEFSDVELSRGTKAGRIVSLIMVPLILAGAGFLMFFGDIEVICGDKEFTVESNMYSDLTVEYDAVDSIEYRDEHDAGVRTHGLGTARLQAGLFQSDEFGNYTRYAYVGCDACVVLTVDGHTLVLTGRNAEDTKAIYDELAARVQTEE